MLIAQLSDTHLDLMRPAKAQALRQAVAHVCQLPLRPDAVIITGDCADHGTSEQYALFRELLAPLPMPVCVVPGNHDQRDDLSRAFGPQGTQTLDGFMQYVVDPDLGQPTKLVVPQQPAACLLHHWTSAGELQSYTSIIGQYPPTTLHDSQQWI